VRIAALAALALLGAAPALKSPRLIVPIACDLGRDCVIQSYVDDDPGPGIRDYACHRRTYQAHDGTDFRLPSMARQRQGVWVLAAAAGTVLRVRDGVEDISIRDRAPGAIAGKECGNGLVVDHGGGWETQYCHLARGSLLVRPLQRVSAGQPVGRVGLSGDTEFPHVHLTLRHDGLVVDPFAYDAPAGACQAGRSLWMKTPVYQEGAVLVAGFATGSLTMAQVQDQGADQQPRPARDRALVVFVQAIGLEEGDRQHIALIGPAGSPLAEANVPPLSHDKAQQLLFVGKQAPAGGWGAGTYTLSYSVVRNAEVVVSTKRSVVL
jgi:hypothetical protein